MQQETRENVKGFILALVAIVLCVMAIMACSPPTDVAGAETSSEVVEITDHNDTDPNTRAGSYSVTSFCLGGVEYVALDDEDGIAITPKLEIEVSREHGYQVADC